MVGGRQPAVEQPKKVVLRRVSTDGEEVVCEDEQEAGEGCQGGAQGAAQRRAEQRQTDRESEVSAVRRTVVEAVSTGMTTARRVRPGARSGSVAPPLRLPAAGARAWRMWAALAALIALAMAAPRASATVVVAKDFAALCAEADLIFVGTVTQTDSRWVDREKQAIETEVTFGDLTWLRGPAQSSITLHFAGGEVDGLREAIAGMPAFTVGERRIIFARKGRYVSPIVGFDQGALRVVEGADGPVVVGPNGAVLTDGAASLNQRGALRGGAPAAQQQQPNAADAQPVPLHDFLDRIRGQIGSSTAP